FWRRSGVYTLGLEYTLAAAPFPLPIFLGGAGLYEDAEGNLGMYFVRARGPGAGLQSGVNVEIGYYPTLDGFKGRGIEIGGAGGADLNFGLNTSWDNEGGHKLAGTALDIGVGGGIAGYYLFSDTYTIPLGTDPIRQGYSLYARSWDRWGLGLGA